MRWNKCRFKLVIKKCFQIPTCKDFLYLTFTNYNFRRLNQNFAKMLKEPVILKLI